MSTATDTPDTAAPQAPDGQSMPKAVQKEPGSSLVASPIIPESR